MKFGRIPVRQAEGAVLAHSMLVYKKKWKKGRQLSRPDVEVLDDLGVDTVVAAVLDEHDVDENTAAEALARTMAGKGVQIRPPATGRCNLYAEHRGLLVLNTGRINQVNSIHENFTVGTLKPYSTVYSGELLASVKIISFGVSRESLNDVISVSGSGLPPVSVFEFNKLSIGLIQTKTAWFNEKLLKKGSEMIKLRAQQLGSRIVEEAVCDHHEVQVAKLVQEFLSKKLDVILLLGASAIQDREDVIPKGIVDAGGRIEHFGMPVDPGNLLLLAAFGKTTIMGLPGCVRSPKRNGFDFVFERLAAGLEVRQEEIMDMGVGGILTESPRRPERRTQVEEAVNVASNRVAAIVLAAGQSRRMGNENKLLMKIGSKSVIRTVVHNLEKSSIDDIFVATGHESEKIQDELQDCKVKFVHNPEYVDGLSTTLRCALAELPSDIGAVLVCQGDMPFVKSRYIDKLISEYDPVAGRNICVPTCMGKRGNPVLWDRKYIPEMMEVKGDVGAKHIIGDYAEYVKDIEVGDAGVLTDLDTPELFEKYSRAVVD